MNRKQTSTLLPTLLAALIVTGSVSSQNQAKTRKPIPPTLAQAVVVEVYEHNLGKAMDLYRKIADDEKQPAADRGQALLRLGKAFRSLGERADAEAVFSQAAKGTGTAAREAKAILAGTAQDDGDLVRAKVQQVLAAMRLTGKSRYDDLTWIGAAAAPHVIKAANAEKADLNFITNCASVLFSIGGVDVIGWIKATHKSEDTLRKRAVVKGYSRAADQVRQAVAGFSNDSESSVRLELIKTSALNAAELIELLQDKDAAVRESARAKIWHDWNRLDHGDRIIANLRAIRPTLAALQTHQYSTKTFSLNRWLERRQSATKAERELLLELFTYPCFASTQVRWLSLPADAAENSHLQAALAAVRKVKKPAGRMTGASVSVLLAVKDCAKTWNRTALPAVLEIAGRGYDDGWAGSWIYQNATPEDVDAIGERLLDLHSQSVDAVCTWMAEKGAPHAVLPKLQRIFTKFGGNQRGWSRSTRITMEAIIAVNSKESIDFVVSQMRPEIGNVMSQALKTSVSPAKRAVLERVLTMPGAQNTKLRADAFEHLVLHYKNPGTPASFAKAYQLGLGGSVRQPGRPTSGNATGLSVLLHTGVSRPQSVSGSSELKCSPVHAAAIARACLAAGQRAAFEDLSSALHSVRDGRILAAIAEQLLACPDDPGGSRNDQNLRSRLLEVYLRNYSSGKLPGHYTTLALAALAHEDVLTRRTMLDKLRIQVLRDDAEVKRAVLRSTSDASASCRYAAVQRIQRARLDDLAALQAMERRLFDVNHPTAEVAIVHLQQHDPARLARNIDKLLSEGGASNRSLAARFWLRHKGVDGLTKVGPLLADARVVHRKDLISQIGSFMDVRAVPYLLQAIKSPETREVAQNMLQTIRFYHEEKSKWGKLMQGSGFATASPAEALIEQFNKSRNQAVRLAAIASLGTLGDAETLPFLVKLIGDSDQKVAEAASAAVAKINSRPAKGK